MVCRNFPETLSYSPIAAFWRSVTAASAAKASASLVKVRSEPSGRTKMQWQSGCGRPARLRHRSRGLGQNGLKLRLPLQLGYQPASD